MPHRFVIRDQEKLHVYTRYDDIPEIFDHVIEFLPEYPPPPHTEADHREIDSWYEKFMELLGRQRASSSEKR